MKVESVKRSFSFNGVTLPDPGPDLSPEQVKDLYAATYPDLTSAQVEGPEIKGNKLVWSFRRAVGTKGASHPPLEIAVVEKDGLLYVVPADFATCETIARLRNFVKTVAHRIDQILCMPPQKTE